jgi:hypothetical protein
MLAGRKADRNEGIAEGGIPVTGAAAEPIKGLLKEPQLIGFAEGTAGGRANDDSLIGGQIGVAKGVLTVALLLGAPHFDGHRGEKTTALLAEDWSKGVALGPGGILMVAEDDDAALSADWIAKFIWLDGLNDHRRENGDFLVFRSILRKADWYVSFVVFKADIFFGVRVEPDGAVRGVGFHGLSEGVWGPMFEFGGRDVVSTRGGRPSKSEGSIKNAGAPCRGEIAQIVGENGLAKAVTLNESPATGGVDEKMALAAAVVGNESDAGVVVDPLGKTWDLGGGVKVAVDGKHGIVRRRHIKGTDIDGVIATGGKETIPFGRGSGDIEDGALIDFTVDEGEGCAGWRERLLRGGTGGDEGTGKAAVVDEVGERIGKGTLGIKLVVG